MDSPVYQIRFERHPSDTDRSGISHQSQASLIGTSCPSRYIDLQKIANLVSSGFQRATKSVEIAHTTYYANLVATSAK
ncbi:hypothetical protein PPACK8108_LOCUS4086, partial [Phakopsora pachyrhizi]